MQQRHAAAAPRRNAFIFQFIDFSAEPYTARIRSSKYRKVFYLDPLEEYVTHHARLESSMERDQPAPLLPSLL